MEFMGGGKGAPVDGCFIALDTLEASTGRLRIPFRVRFG